MQNRSEHYFHSNFADLVITGLAVIIPSADDTLTVHPLAPDSWDYFALDQVKYRGHLVSVVWDRAGTRYGFGKGLQVIVNGKLAAHLHFSAVTALTKASGGRKSERLAWWREARFGGFVHWRASSQLANQWHGKRGPGYAGRIRRAAMEHRGSWPSPLIQADEPGLTPARQ